MGSRSTETSRLFQPLKVGRMTLSHRVVMAPLTRLRADDTRTHTDLAVEYYRQRSTTPGTLLITEATPISLFAGHYPNVPGIYTQPQIDAWKRVTDAVHKNGSFIYLQMWALGRADKIGGVRQAGHDLISASDIPMDDNAPKPRSMTKTEIKGIVNDYAQASRAAMAAGFDGVEIHNANGYLPDQFMQEVSNQRTDEYGGSIENRARFPLEIVEAVSEAIGQDRVGVRLSPFGTFQGMGMDDDLVHKQFGYYAQQLRDNYPKLAYLHVVEARVTGGGQEQPGHICEKSIDFLQDIWGHDRIFFRAGGFDADKAIAASEKEGNENNAIVIGRWYISNPDLPERIRRGKELAPYNRKTFYLVKQSEGYIDYPIAEKHRL